jgi:hypothetical protein
MRYHFALLSSSILLSLNSISQAEKVALLEIIPDLTKSIDFERKGEFHLGPTGLKGWINTGKNFMTTNARQILVTKISPGSPAEENLKVGDVIIGTGDKPFDRDARRALGDAINTAEREKNDGKLKIIYWRPKMDTTVRTGSISTAELNLPVMGSYSETSPWNCPKSERILTSSLNNLLERNDFGRFGASALALLATGEQKYIDIVHDYIHKQKWAKPDIKISVEQGGLVSWSCGYQNLLLTEYHLLTGDNYVLPAIREYAVKTAMGQSHGGTWGHGFAWKTINDGNLHGRLSGYGALNQSGLPCYLSLLLAKKCGIEHPEIDAAISRASRFFSEFIDNGSIGYGYHRPSLEVYSSGKNGLSGNGKNGIAAVAFQVEGHNQGQQFFSKLTASLYNTCEYGHSGNSYSYFWDPLGANCGGPKLVSSFLKELQWHYALTRLPDGRFANQPLGGHYGGEFLDPTAAQIMIATLPRRAIHLTGKGQNESIFIGAKEVKETIRSGRWRLTNTDKMTPDEIIAGLDDWSPAAREWAAKALAEKKGDFTSKLLELLQNGNPAARAGACTALGHCGERSTRAIPEISKALNDREDRVAIAAGYALARLGKTAEKALPDLMRALILCSENGSLHPRQQALGYAFGHVRARTAPLYFNGLLAQAADDGNPLDGLDRPLLYSAVSKLLLDPSGRVRGCGAFAFQYFNREDASNMAQEIYDAIKIPSMSYMMFEDSPRVYALDLMARFHLKEGIPLALETFGLKRWGAYARFPARFKTLQAYAGSAQPSLPQLYEMRQNWKSGEHRENLEKTIKIIETDKEPIPLISLHNLVDERLIRDLANHQKDENQVDLCRAFMKKHPRDFYYQAACLRYLSTQLGEDASTEVQQALASPNEILRKTAISLEANLSKRNKK